MTERASAANRQLEFAHFPDGVVAVGFSNETEDGGFTVLGYVTEALKAERMRHGKELYEAVTVGVHNALENHQEHSMKRWCWPFFHSFADDWHVSTSGKSRIFRERECKVCGKVQRRFRTEEEASAADANKTNG